MTHSEKLAAEILANNRLIFDFMNCIHSADEEMDNWEMNKLKYHSSWDCLIPVVEKIESLQHITKEGNWGNYYVDITSKTVSLNYGRFRIGEFHKAATKIEAVYNAILYFIRYNQNK